MAKREGQKLHRDRKNPGSRERYERDRREKNTKRGRLVYDLETKIYNRMKP